MTPDHCMQRAVDLRDKIHPEAKDSPMLAITLDELAAALRAVESETLERAAVLCETMAKRDYDYSDKRMATHGSADVRANNANVRANASSERAYDIRKLKSTPPPADESAP